MKYYVIVLPKSTDGSVNRQIYESATLAAAKQSFHTNCSKYFGAASLVQCSVSIVDELLNEIDKDVWVAETAEV